MALPVTPDFEWYAARSKAAGVPPRCPIASAELCPRYYASLWLLANAKVTTAIPDEEQRRLNRKWEPFKPTISEEEPSLTKADDELRGLSGFCPEVSYEIFHLFVSQLHLYADEIDRGYAYEMLAQEHATASDPRWRWASFTPRHFTECREFSIFSKAELHLGKGRKRSGTVVRQGLGPKLRWQVLARDAFTCQYCGRRPPEAVLEVDHRIPVARGGSNDIENLFTACLECNRGKGTEDVGESDGAAAV